MNNQVRSELFINSLKINLTFAPLKIKIKMEQSVTETNMK